jgi:hypothetical protein
MKEAFKPSTLPNSGYVTLADDRKFYVRELPHGGFYVKTIFYRSDTGGAVWRETPKGRTRDTAIEAFTRLTTARGKS